MFPWSLVPIPHPLLRLWIYIRWFVLLEFEQNPENPYRSHRFWIWIQILPMPRWWLRRDLASLPIQASKAIDLVTQMITKITQLEATGDFCSTVHRWTILQLLHSMGHKVDDFQSHDSDPLTLSNATNAAIHIILLSWSQPAPNVSNLVRIPAGQTLISSFWTYTRARAGFY